MTRQRPRFEHIDSHTYAAAPLSAGLAGGRGRLRKSLRYWATREGHASCHSVQRRLTREELICYLQGLCRHLRGIAAAPVLPLLAVATRHRHRDVQRSCGDGFLCFVFLRFSENNAKYGRMEKQEDLPVKDEALHVSSEGEMQTGGPSRTHFQSAFILLWVSYRDYFLKYNKCLNLKHYRQFQFQSGRLYILLKHKGSYLDIAQTDRQIRIHFI